MGWDCPEWYCQYDDHDYGKNDAGVEFEMKDESQQLFLDFLDVPKDSPRRKQRGVYHSKTFNTKDGSVKLQKIYQRS